MGIAVILHEYTLSSPFELDGPSELTKVGHFFEVCNI